MNKSIIINAEDIQHYIKELRKIPLITPEREVEIFEELKSKKLTESERSKLKEELIRGNLRFVISIAKTYQNQGLHIMDLISDGNIGLMKAVDRFDVDSGYKFISYAVWWIRQSIKASLNDNGRIIRIPSNVIQETHKDNKSREKCSEDNMYKKGSANYSLPYTTSLSNQINEDGDSLIEIIPNQNADNPEERLNSPEEIKKKVNFMLSVLDEREKVIIEKYFGLTGVESNLDDLGEEFGCTKERIRQIKERGLRKLRNHSYDFFKYYGDN